MIVWANMPIPRHRLLVVLLATSLCCFNLVLSQELRPFESETSSPSHQSSRNPEDYENLVISPAEAKTSETTDEESSDDGDQGEEEGGDEEGGDDEEGEEEGEEEEGEEAQASVLSPQFALPLSNFSQLAYPDSNVSASSIIYRTADLDTAATG